ncbi:MAG: AraC family transcriptional regulator, partial [Clostridia bacterium]|nr:AraC family transcriptional regulator [Clostridia bacterium]
RGHSVEAAAEACGYASPSALYKAVRAETGKAPSALKAKKRK